MSLSSLIFLAVTAITGFVVGGVYGLSKTAASSLWSRARTRLIGKALFVVAFVVLGVVPFTVALAAPFYFFRDVSPEVGVSGYIALFICLGLGLVAGRWLSRRQQQNAP